MDTTSSESGETSPYAKGLTTGRVKSLAGGVFGLISLIIGWRARTRVARGHSTGLWPTVALVFGLVAIGLSVVHLASVTGGFGTGGGKAGAIVALVAGLIGTALSGLALWRKENRKS